MQKFFNNFNKVIIKNFTFISSKVDVVPQCMQNRLKHYQVTYHGGKNYWPEWTMMKNYKKRMIFKEYGPFRLRLNAVRKNVILPSEIRTIADHEIATVPRFSGYLNIEPRCSVTSRGRGVVKRWRLSRIIFRHLADYNKLAGVQRAFWG